MGPVAVKLKRGRSKASRLIVAGRNLHVFVWLPRMGGDSLGATVRWRRGQENWSHLRLTLLQRNALGASALRHKHGRVGRFAIRRTLTIAELSSWTTRGGTRERVDIKWYVRLKAGAGGRQIDNGEVTPTANARARRK